MIYISPQKLKELKKELERRKMVLRKQITERIQEAQDLGDITENAEYIEAKEVQASNEIRIMELKKIISTAVVASRKATKKDIVRINSQIIVKNKKGEKFKFVIVGSEDANPIEGKISNESPLGRAFLKHKEGDEIMVQTPKGKMVYKISRIN